MAAALVPALSYAEEVRLKSADGTVNLVGEFVDFVDDNYVIRTALGDLRISAARVRCEGAACPVFETATADLVFAGSDTVGLGMMPLVLAGYASHLDAEASIKATSREGEIIAQLIGDGGFGDEIGSFLVTSTGSSDAFKYLLDESAQFGMASRRIRPQEARELKAAGGGNMISPSQEHIIAIDSLVVITHPSNPISALSLEQVGDIYAGRITNWSALGGPNLPIKVLNRDPGSGTRSTFYEGIYGDQADRIPAIGQIAPDNNIMAAMVNEDPAAIGFVGYAFQRGAKALPLINACGMTRAPDAFSAKTEEYPLQRRLYLYTRADTASEGTQDFIDYVTSEEADPVIAKSGFIDLGIKLQDMGPESMRALTVGQSAKDAYEARFVETMMAEMADYQRLSTTFRFRTGSSRLDERARLDMARLVNFIETLPEGVEIRVVGFTDNVGAFDSNRALSIDRARSVASELVAFAGDRLNGVTVDVAGFGEIAPSACNITDQGKAINRRVEIWLKQAQAS